jgi:hypothetical protein
LDWVSKPDDLLWIPADDMNMTRDMFFNGQVDQLIDILNTCITPPESA